MLLRSAWILCGVFVWNGAQAQSFAHVADADYTQVFVELVDARQILADVAALYDRLGRDPKLSAGLKAELEPALDGLAMLDADLWARAGIDLSRGVAIGFEAGRPGWGPNYWYAFRDVDEAMLRAAIERLGYGWLPKGTGVPTPSIFIDKQFSLERLGRVLRVRPRGRPRGQLPPAGTQSGGQFPPARPLSETPEYRFLRSEPRHRGVFVYVRLSASTSGAARPPANDWFGLDPEERAGLSKVGLRAVGIWATRDHEELSLFPHGASSPLRAWPVPKPEPVPFSGWLAAFDGHVCRMSLDAKQSLDWLVRHLVPEAHPFLGALGRGWSGQLAVGVGRGDSGVVLLHLREAAVVEAAIRTTTEPLGAPATHIGGHRFWLGDAETGAVGIVDDVLVVADGRETAARLLAGRADAVAGSPLDQRDDICVVDGASPDFLSALGEYDSALEAALFAAAPLPDVRGELVLRGVGHPAGYRVSTALGMGYWRILADLAVRKPRLMVTARKFRGWGRAVANIQRMVEAAAAWYGRQRAAGIPPGPFPPTTPLTPPRPCNDDTATPPDWEAPGWKTLGFTTEDRGRYSYQFVSGFVEGQHRFTARALGDLDCDGELSTFERVGWIEADGALKPGAGFFTEHRDE